MKQKEDLPAPEPIDLSHLVPAWTEQASCIGRWEEFDSNIDTDVAMVCWSECSVRRQCLSSAIKSERESFKVSGDYIATTGIRGGYTVPERLLLHQSLDWDYLDLETV